MRFTIHFPVHGTARHGPSRAGLVLALAAPLWLAACGGTPSATAPAAGGAAAAVTPAATVRALDGVQRRLKDEFAGTPVTVTWADANRLQVGVPLRHAFAPGRAVVRPPLGAVLDRVAREAKPLGGLGLSVSAPADAGKGSGVLAAERTAATRDWLVGQGVAAARVSAQVLAGEERVLLTLAPLGGPAR
jgi:outer membrane protein OmpA-like peptidoglycan-associated protein